MKKVSGKRGVLAVDLFCGAGGLTHGMSQGGIDVRAGIDIDNACKYAYEKNNESTFVHQDITKLQKEDIEKYFTQDNHTVLAGCAPCQPFSKYTNNQPSCHSKWGMLEHFARLVREVKPDIVTMENVPQIRLHSVFADFVTQLEQEGYEVSYSVVFCPDYGIPQSRSRLVLFASKFGKMSIIEPTHTSSNYKTVRETISDLPKISSGESCSSDAIHASSRLSDLNMTRIKASKPGGSWSDWDDDLVAKCHRGEGRGSYSSIYGRMEWDKPAPTITTQFTGFGNGRFGHPEQDRGLSIREGALLQTFPKDYKFSPEGSSISKKSLTTMIGNAVPVDLGRVIAETITKHLEEYHGR